MKAPVPSQRVVWRLTAAVIACTIFLLGFLLVRVVVLEQRAEQSAATDMQSLDEREDLRAENAEQDAKLTLLVEQLQALGQEPVVTPSDPSPAPVGLPSLGLIQSLVDIGLTARCGGSDCKGDPGLPAPPAKDGANGRDGETPSTELLLSLIQPLIPAPVAGADGVGIVSIVCTSPSAFPLSFEVVLSNGVTQSVACPALVDPEPDPPEVAP